MLKANAILKEMSGIDIADEGIPSKAIWNPSGSLSSNSSVASSSGSSTGMEDPNPASAYTSSTPAAFEAALPSVKSTDTETSLKVYEDNGSEDGQADDQTDDDNRMSAMLMSSINTAHGSEDATKLGKGDRKNDKLFGSTNDERRRFVNSLENLSNKQLRIQLWDSFRLARVILGKPVKDKRKLSHKSILHAIRKVAEMKIQIIRMSEELERYRHRENKLKRLREKNQKTLGKENQEVQDAQKSIQMAIDGLSISSSVLSPVSSGGGVDGPGSIHDVISDSDSPDIATAKLREHAIKILQQESDLALSQLQEMDQRQRKRRRFDETDEKLLGSSHPNSPPIFLSPSESEDDMSYGTHESASDMLYAFRGQRSPLQQQELLVSTGTLETEGDEIRRVLQRVVDFENDQREPEITTEASSSAATTQVHQEVIALLTRLTQIEPTSMLSPLNATNLLEDPTRLPSKEPEALELKAIPVAKTETTNKTLAVKKETNEEFPHDEMPLEEPDVQMDMEDEVEKEIAECRALNVIDEVEEDLAECRSQFAAAKQRVAESMEHHKHLSLQREMLEEDIAHAHKNTTQNREQVQLERLHRYKKELSKFLKREEERAKQLDALDAELDDLATHCVKLEDREAVFREKHEKHTSALKDFKAVNNMHTEKFRQLMGSIDRGIKEQTETVFSPQKKRKGRNDTSNLLSQGSESFEDDDDDENEEMAKKVQRLEYNLTRKNMEIFRLKAKLMVQERSSIEGKPNEVSFVKPEGKANEEIKIDSKKGKKKRFSGILFK